MNNPSTLLRLLYQRLKARDGGNLAGLVPRALPDAGILPGTSEFVLTKAMDLDEGGWSSAGLLIPRQYQGFIAVHYALDTDQLGTLTDEGNIVRVLSTFPLHPTVQAEEAFRSFGHASADWFLNTEPVKAQKAAVMTLSFDWSLVVDLTVQEAPTP